MVTLSVDVMGGDHGPSVILPACHGFLQAHPDAQLLLFGLPGAHGGWAHARATWLDAQSMVTMDDPVEVALRRKKGSSMRLAIEAVRDGQADAAVSSGNTGALMAIARYVLKTMPGIDRPAIAGHMPNAKGQSTTVLDMGANVDCSPEHLVQFALMGTALVSAIKDLPSPTVGLLNIGEEDIKGNDIIKKSGEMLKSVASEGLINFYGNVEGNDIFKGTTDLVVCDGFVGNVALKASEGLAAMVGHFLRESFNRNWLTKAIAVLAMPVLKEFKFMVDHRRHNGAALLGLNGLVFKSHGSADAVAFEVALNRAYDASRHGLLAQVQSRLSSASDLIDAFTQTSDTPVPLEP
jgi:glycerol-3-phosphate acyltransferase PlsX